MVSPVKLALNAILPNPLPSGRERSVWSYREDFHHLWDEKGLLNNVPNLSMDLVIIWDGVPEPPVNSPKSNINVADHVTVYDWIVALCCVARKLDKTQLPALRLFVLDLAPPQHSAAFGTTMFPRFLPELPWLRIYRPVARNEESIRFLAEACAGNAHAEFIHRRVLGPDFLGAEALLSDLEFPFIQMPNLVESEGSEVSPALALSRLQAGADSLRLIWISELTKAETRHSVSNLVAPLILASVFDSPELRNKLENDGRRLALRRLLKSLGLIEIAKPTGGSAVAPLIDDKDYFPPAERDPFDCFRNVGLLLVDDQYHIGYEDVLRFLVFGDDASRHDSKKITIDATASPKCLVDALYKAAEIVPPSERPDSETGFLQQLIDFFDKTGACMHYRDLDPALLRAARTARSILSRAADFAPAGDCCRYCGRPSEHETNGFPWELPHEFKPSVMPRASVVPDPSQVGLQSESPSPERVIDILLLDLRLFDGSDQIDRTVRPELHQLLLLPLLINHVDPSFPIILFSSTQQRFVADAMVHFPNVITAFSKPLMSGYGQDWPTSIWIENLSKALLSALKIHQARSVWGSLTKLSNRVVSRPAGSLTIREQGLRRPRPNEKKPVEFTLDREMVTQLKKEYARLMLRGSYADALAVPDNLLEKGGYDGLRPDLLIGWAILSEKRQGQEQWSATLDRIMGEASYQSYSPDLTGLLALALKGLARSQSGARADRMGSLAEFFEENPGIGNSWRNEFARQNRSVWNGLGRDPTNRKYVLDGLVSDALTDTMGNSLQSGDYQIALQRMAAFQFYAPIGAFRNLRSHYGCRPWDHDGQLEKYAIWIWLWFCNGLTLLADGTPPCKSVQSARRSTLVEAVEKRLLPKTGYQGEGIEACYALIRGVKGMIDLGLIELSGEMKSLKQAADRFVLT